MLNLLKTLILFSLLNTNLYGSNYSWLDNYDEAIKLAQKENKDIYLFIGANICNFCTKYKEQTLSNEEVMKRLTKDYIPVYLSRDQHLIPDKFEQYGVPRHYFLDFNGQVFFDTQGLLEISGFYTMLDEAELSKE
ncbi:MAG: thioredoxin [Arcobacter sp.]|nr:MAG: thioredoxin [Arcobacter sp.]